jgi:hypothetical protein
LPTLKAIHAGVVADTGARSTMKVLIEDAHLEQVDHGERSEQVENLLKYRRRSRTLT